MGIECFRLDFASFSQEIVISSSLHKAITKGNRWANVYAKHLLRHNTEALNILGHNLGLQSRMTSCWVWMRDIDSDPSGPWGCLRYVYAEETVSAMCTQ